MPKILLPFAALILLSFTSLRRPVEPLAKERDLASLFPDSTLLLVEGPGLSKLLDDGLEHPLVREVLRSPLGASFGGADAIRARLAVVDAIVGYEILPTLAKLGSRGAALGLEPRGGQAAWVLVLHGDDEELLAETLQKALDHAAKEAGYPRAFERPSDRVLGADVWNIGEDLVVARRDGLLIASNEGAYGRRVLELASDADAKGLTARAAFNDARAAADGVLLSAWIDFEQLRARGDGGGEGLRGLAKLPTEPAAQFLLGPNLAGLGGARHFSTWIEVDDDRLSLGVRGHGTTDRHVLMSRVDEKRPPLPARTADDVAVAHLYRDLAGVFRHRAELFAPEVLPTLSKPISELAVLFGGADLSETVLPGVSPWITLVARRIEFDGAAVPDIRLPALAGIFRLEDADTLAPRLTAAFQTLIAVSNIERAQQAQDPMVMGIALEGTTSVSHAAFLAPPDGEGVDLRYNLEPACAQVGELFVLGTHDALVRQLVREIAGAKTVATSQTADTLYLDGAALAGFVEGNFEALVMDKVLDDGIAYDEAEGEIAALGFVLDLVTGARVTLEPERDETLLMAELDFGSRRETVR